MLLTALYSGTRVNAVHIDSITPLRYSNWTIAIIMWIYYSAASFASSKYLNFAIGNKIVMQKILSLKFCSYCVFFRTYKFLNVFITLIF